MARRVIHECDLTKREFDPENEKVFTLSIAVKGKKAPMKYELSASTAEKVLAQLNGSNTLKEDWSFSNGDYAPAVDDTPEERPRRTLGDLEDEDDSQFVADKKAELREAGLLREEDEPVAESVINVTSGCTHINKGPIQTTLRKGKRHIFRRCKECQTKVPEMSSADRQGFMGGQLPADVRLRDLD